MVFFTCDACGESVKKGQVEKHVGICRSCQCLSCMDCGKDFWGDDYKGHVKCISEDQKYGGRGYEGKAHKGDIKQQAWIQGTHCPLASSGDPSKKVNESMKRPSVSPKVRELLGQISGFDNIPRKKAKFQNWMKNSLKIHNTMLLEQVWDIFAEASMNDPPGAQPPKQPLNQVAQPCAEVSGRSPPESPAEPAEAAKKNKRERKEERQKGRKKEKKELKVEAQENAGRRKPKRAQGQEDGAGAEAPATNGVAPGKKAKKKRERAQGPGEGAASGAGGPREHSAGKRKRKHSEGEADCKKKKMKLPEPPEQEVTPVKGKFNWKGTIKAVLKQAPDNEIAVKKLKKKVLAQYYSVASEQHRSEEELLVIFNKKISKNPAFRVLKDKVKLLK